MKLAWLLLFCAAVSAQEAKIQITPAIEAKAITTSNAYVVGKDLKFRTCPEDYNVYVRKDGTKPVDKNLYYVPPKTTLMPNNGVGFSIVCVKELP